MSKNLTEQIREIGIVPVIKLDDAAKAAPLAKALCEGGLPCAEVTFRTECAADAIRAMKAACPEMLVGAGTVLTTQQVDSAMEAGSEFIVSPGLNPDIVKYCVDRDIPVFPGCANPSDVEQAIKYDLRVVKFFPAEAMGGLKTISAMAPVYSQICFMPTGGINASNVCDYLKNDRIIACGGTWMVPADAIARDDFDLIRKLTQEAVHTMLGFRLAHVGINCADLTEAQDVAKNFEDIFGFAANENPGSIFSAGYIESLKTPYLGTKGHIAIAVNSIERAVAYLNKKGVTFNEESTVYMADGKIKAIYMEKEIGGFAIHLVRTA